MPKIQGRYRHRKRGRSPAFISPPPAEGKPGPSKFDGYCSGDLNVALSPPDVPMYVTDPIFQKDAGLQAHLFAFQVVFALAEKAGNRTESYYSQKKWLAGKAPIHELALAEIFEERADWLAMYDLPVGTPLGQAKPQKGPPRPRSR